MSEIENTIRSNDKALSDAETAGEVFDVGGKLRCQLLLLVYRRLQYRRSNSFLAVDCFFSIVHRAKATENSINQFTLNTSSS